jgi:myosin heavy subunit
MGGAIGSRGGSQHGSRSNTMIREEDEAPKPAAFDFSALTSTLEKMSTMIASNSAQIQALSVAQSSGLQSMQAINESNSTQIKNLTDNQAKLQQLIDQNASHYIALSNSSFQNHDQVKKTMGATAEQLATLSSNQTQLTKTCTSMMKSIESVSKNMSGLADGVRALSERDSQRERERESRDRQRRTSDASTASSAGTAPRSVSGNKISPGPRKLNRKIRGVWYEYDSALLDATPKSNASSSVST